VLPPIKVLLTLPQTSWTCLGLSLVLFSLLKLFNLGVSYSGNCLKLKIFIWVFLCFIVEVMKMVEFFFFFIDCGTSLFLKKTLEAIHLSLLWWMLFFNSRKKNKYRLLGCYILARCVLFFSCFLENMLFNLRKLI
jgi:hypothetical protein